MITGVRIQGVIEERQTGACMFLRWDGNMQSLGLLKDLEQAKRYLAEQLNAPGVAWAYNEVAGVRVWYSDVVPHKCCDPKYTYEVTGEGHISIDARCACGREAGALWYIDEDGCWTIDTSSDGCSSNIFEHDGCWPRPPRDVRVEARQIWRALQEEGNNE
jgi:hypothetical protein